MSGFAAFFWTKCHRSDAGASFRWMLFLTLAAALMPTFGSTICFVFGGGALVAWTYYFLSPSTFRPDKREFIIIAILGSYLAITLLFALSNDGRVKGLEAVASNLGFLLMLPLLPVLRHYYKPYWERWLLVAFAAAGILSGLTGGLLALFARADRVEAFTGNSLIYAYLAGACVLVNVVLVLQASGKTRLLHGVAILFAAAALLVSGSRAPIIFVALIAVFWALAWFSRPSTRSRSGIVFTAYLAALGIAVLYEFFRGSKVFMALVSRFESLLQTLAAPGVAGADLGFSERWTMLRAGIAAFLHHPFIGYGRQNVVKVANQQFLDDIEFGYSHLHNAYVTEAVASGVFGLIAFLAVLVTPILAARRASSPWPEISFMFFLYTFLYNLTNIGFYHDIKVFYYCIFICLLNCITTKGTRSAIRDKVAISYASFLSVARPSDRRGRVDSLYSSR